MISSITSMGMNIDWSPGKSTALFNSIDKSSTAFFNAQVSYTDYQNNIINDVPMSQAEC